MHLTPTDTHRQALRYVLNTGETVTAAQFDDDNDPIGPMLRNDLVPLYLRVDSNGVLKLTEAGRREVNAR